MVARAIIELVRLAATFAGKGESRAGSQLACSASLRDTSFPKVFIEV